MELKSDNLKLIFGIKLKQLRKEKGLSLKEFASKTNLSISYISEIESGKKYPQIKKIIHLASALGVSYDELVSPKVNEETNPVTAFMKSPIFQEFPFQMFGFTLNDVVDLMKDSPKSAAALIRTLTEIGEMYDMKVEQFFFAALRSYQKMHNNYFDEIEIAADIFLRELNWPSNEPLNYDILAQTIESKYHCQIDESTISRFPELQSFRSIRIDGHPPRLLINARLMPPQKAFILGHEMAYEYLKMKERPMTSSWLKVESFDQVLNNFKASYFAGALLIPRDRLVEDLKRFFQNPVWNPDAFVKLMDQFDSTPEMFMYRLTQLIPKYLNLNEIYFLRFNNVPGTDHFQLTKELNMTRYFVPHGIGLNEHYCHRWLSIKLLQQLANLQVHNNTPHVLADIQRSTFIDSEAEFITISLVRPLVLSEKTNSCVTIGFLIDSEFKKRVRFHDDPSIPTAQVNETCERCSLKDCRERAAEPQLYEKQKKLEMREQALIQLVNEIKRNS
ncbi:MAG: helix-turn-helix domain-containing protein [Phycisphaerae bacterium]|nr:helix-turn-helix domain-containing protein [Phycisphaerae bacterium]